MFKQKYVLEVKGNEDRVSRFECDPLAPLGELLDANYAIRNLLVNQLNDQHKKAAPKKEKPSEACKEKNCKKEEGKA